MELLDHDHDLLGPCLRHRGPRSQQSNDYLKLYQTHVSPTLHFLQDLLDHKHSKICQHPLDLNPK